MFKKSVALAALLLSTAAAHAQFGRGEVSVAYGFAPVTNWIDAYSDLLAGGRDLEGWGAVTVGYDFRLPLGFAVGAHVVYSSNEQKMRQTREKIDSRYWTVMPNVSWQWLDLRIVRLYSRLGVGATFSKAKHAGDESSSTQFAFQLSPLCVDVGGRVVGAFAEAGIGTSGCFLVGVRCRF